MSAVRRQLVLEGRAGWVCSRPSIGCHGAKPGSNYLVDKLFWPGSSEPCQRRERASQLVDHDWTCQELHRHHRMKLAQPASSHLLAQVCGEVRKTMSHCVPHALRGVRVSLDHLLDDSQK